MSSAVSWRASAIVVALSLVLPSIATAQEGGEAQGPAEERRHDVVGPIVMMSAGGLVVVGGLTLFLVGAADKAAVEDAPDGARWADYSAQAERGPIFLGVGQIMMAAGLIFVGAGLTWLVLDLLDADPDPFGTADLRLDVGPAGAVLGGRF